MTEFYFSHLRIEIIKVFSDPLYLKAVNVELNKIYRISSKCFMNQRLNYVLLWKIHVMILGSIVLRELFIEHAYKLLVECIRAGFCSVIYSIW